MDKMKENTWPPPSGYSKRPEDHSSSFKLVVSMSDTVRSVTLEEGTSYTIGRDRTCDIVVAHNSVSRKHSLLRVGHHPEIEDTGSRNGTRVDGRLLTTGERASLRAGSIVHLGSVTMFVLDESAPHEPKSSRNSSSSWRAATPIHAATDSELAPGFVLRDERMLALYRSVRVIAESSMPVLVLGETGVGKEVLAHSINAMSSRRTRPFVKFNAAALPESLAESELFGHVRGAFTGADKTKEGLFEAANGGTLFLDEVGEVSLQTQAKLLRVIETGELFRVGAAKPTTVDVRVISATNRDLSALISARQFRADLYYRLSGVTLHIPPLRDRPADIPALTEFFANAYARKTGKPAPSLSAEAMAALCAHRWPGNARELKNVVERACLVAGAARVEVDHLHLKVEQVEWLGDGDARELTDVVSSPESKAVVARLRGTAPKGAGVGAAEAGPPSSGDLADKLRQELARQERERIEAALANTSGNQVMAARLLGISRRTLINRLDALGISRPRKGRS
jgi:transcriptional regulator with GAF, ATPase, and Fis domain